MPTQRVQIKLLKAGTLFLLCLLLLPSCGPPQTQPSLAPPTQPPIDEPDPLSRTIRLALWLAKKDELMGHETATYDLVMSGWFDPAEAEILRERSSSMVILAGLTHTWILEDPGWITLLHAIANGGDPAGPQQVTEDMYLGFDDNGDGIPERPCSLPGWDAIKAMDPRHPHWRSLIFAFYEEVARQAQHAGVVVDMVDAYPFCEGAWSLGVPQPIDAQTWVAAQAEILAQIRALTPPEKWVLANAGRDFPEGSTFPQYLNGYLLENFLGSWGATLEEGLASAERAQSTTQFPHHVVFAVDTDDTGTVDWARFRQGFTASLLLDNTSFAFDFGPQDHGGVADWWFPEVYTLDLGEPLGSYEFTQGVYRRDYEGGIVLVGADSTTELSFDGEFRDHFTGETGRAFVIAAANARILLRE